MLCAKYAASEELVRSIHAPEFTDTWHPISHNQMLDMVMGSIQRTGFEVIGSEYGMTNSNKRMFGVLTLTGSRIANLLDDSITMAIGVRNSIDQSLAAALAYGTRVFVCDNLGFAGEEVFTKRHTGTIEEELPLMMDETLLRFAESFKVEARQYESWKEVELKLIEATDFLVRMADRSVLPPAGILRCRNLFLQPPHEEFSDPTVWSLLNAVTYYAKERRPRTPFDASEESMKQLQMFKAEWPLSLAT